MMHDNLNNNFFLQTLYKQNGESPRDRITHTIVTCYVLLHSCQTPHYSYTSLGSPQKLPHALLPFPESKGKLPRLKEPRLSLKT